MEYKCELIKDLMPLYHDGVCSEASASAVEEHLAHCEACKDAYQALLRSDGVTPESPPSPEPQALGESLKRVKRRAAWKTVIACVLAVAVLATGVASTIMWLNASTVVMPVDIIGQVTMEDVKPDPDGDYRQPEQLLHIILKEEYEEEYNLDHVYLCSRLERCDADRDGQDEYILLCLVGTSRWNYLLDHFGLLDNGQYQNQPRDFTMPFTWEGHWNPPPNDSPVDQINESLFRVYYVPDTKLLEDFFNSDPDTQRHILEEKAVLLWEQPKTAG